METENTHGVTFREALRFWFKLGWISFGGPTGQIAIMHTELVEKRKWISDSRFLHALNYCMLLPGPEAQQLAIYIGWLLHRTAGGIAAGALFVVPSIFILWLLGVIYVIFGKVFWIASIFYGLKAAVVAIVAAAVLRIGMKALKNEIMWLIAAAAFVSLFFFHAPFPVIILAAGLLGLAGGRLWPGKFQVIRAHGGGGNGSLIDDHTETPEHAHPSGLRALKVLLVCGILWWAPVFALGFWQGHGHVWFQLGLFFSKAAMVTFGGAYAVLPYVSQQAVEHYGWLNAGQMMDGLGLAETTPGPLIMVVQFVGFLAGWNHPGGVNPLIAATVAALLTTWVTFVPCFLWVFLGAPHIEQLRNNARMTAGLSAITAAVVGVVLNLAVWFAIHALFPAERQADWFLLVLSAVCFAGMTKGKWGIIPVVAAASALGLLYRLATG